MVPGEKCEEDILGRLDPRPPDALNRGVPSVTIRAPGPAPRALGGLRICDLSGQLAGAGATRFLAAFGAQVIRVEDPSNQGRWDILRGADPSTMFGGAFNNHNVEKLGVTINLRTDRGKELFKRLVAVSDVV